MVMKGLPLAYAKDMQEDKERVFDALDALALSVAAMTGMVEDLEPDLPAMKRSPPPRATRPRPTLPTGWCSSSSFPSARPTTSPGGSWRSADVKGVELKALSLADFQSVEPRITREAFHALDVAGSVKSRKSYGGTAPTNVRTPGQTVDKAFGEGRLVAIKGMVEGPRKGPRDRGTTMGSALRILLALLLVVSVGLSRLRTPRLARPAEARLSRGGKPTRQPRCRRFRPVASGSTDCCNRLILPQCTISPTGAACPTRTCSTPRRSTLPASPPRWEPRSIAIRRRRSSGTIACSPTPSPSMRRHARLLFGQGQLNRSACSPRSARRGRRHGRRVRG